jgi:hypothetical protein
MDSTARTPPHATVLDRRLLAASWRSWTSNDLDRVGPLWLQWVWTLLFSAVLAVFFTLLGAVSYAGERAWRWESLGYWALWYGKNFVVCITIASLIHLLFDLGGALLGGPPRIRRLKPWQRSLFFAGVPMLGVVLGWPLGVWLSGSAELMPKVLASPGALTGTVTLALAISLALHFLFAARTREIEAERRATEAQLRLLQAQIEPHFLFNTLANVHALVDVAPAQAKAMLGAFTDYLRASLGTLRADLVPLSDELALAEAYLRVQQLRMEDRLHWTIDAEPAARSALLPPLLLQPLVENAVVHGLEPSVNGGTVRLLARVQGGQLRVEVHDDGLGLHTPRRAGGRSTGNGLALKNLRDRLQTRYGAGATLQAEAAHPGTRACITLPLETAEPTAAGRAGRSESTPPSPISTADPAP